MLGFLGPAMSRYGWRYGLRRRLLLQRLSGRFPDALFCLFFLKNSTEHCPQPPRARPRHVALREFRCMAGGVSLVVCEVCQLLLSPCKWRTLTTTPQLQGELYAPRRRKRSAVTCSNRQPIAKHAAATVELGVVVLLAQQNRLSHIDRSGCLVLTSTSSLHLACEIIVTRCHLQ